MSKGCGFCHICDLNHCPKEGKSPKNALKHIGLRAPLIKKLDVLCQRKNFMKGEAYYKVPDYNAALAFLLDKEDISDR